MGYRFQEAPRQDCVEQVYVHDVVEDQARRVSAALVNRQLEGGLGVAIEFDRHQLSYLLQWQNFQAGSYCVAIEPSTSHALGRPYAEAHGELAWLRHGDERSYDLRVAVLSGELEIADFESAVRRLAPDPPDPLSNPREGFGSG